MTLLDPASDLQTQFLTSQVCVQRDDAGAVLVTSSGLRRWLHVWWSRSQLAQYLQLDPGEVDCGLLTGGQLRDWLRVHAPDAGVIAHTLNDESIVLRAQRRCH